MTTGYAWAKRTMTKLLREEMAASKRNKFNAKKVKIGGLTFDSQAEARHYGELKIREAAKEITRLQVHPRFELRSNGKLIATYKPDFMYLDVKENRTRVIDVKSPPTAKRRDFIIIAKLFEAQMGFPVEVVT